jgi:type II secretory pathway component PulF
MFAQNKVNSIDSTIILSSVSNLMKLGKSLFEAIKLQEEISDGKNKKILKLIIKQTVEKNITIELLLLKHGIISEAEKLIMLNNKDTKDSIKDILKMRRLNKNFDKTIFSLAFFPVIAVFIGLAIVKFLLPIISKPITELITIAELKKGIKMDNALDIDPAFFYIHHPEYINIVAIVFVSLLASLFFGFKYLEKKNPSILYKIIPLKSYDDIPFIFILMRALNKGGMDIYSIASTLHHSNLNLGWKRFFFRLKNNIDKNQELYTVFKNFGFPKELYIVLKASEKSKSFWDNFDEMIEYANNTNLDKNLEFKTRYKGLASITGYFIIFYFLIGILLLSMAMQNIVTAMQ